jgi:hypothetical protein
LSAGYFLIQYCSADPDKILFQQCWSKAEDFCRLRSSTSSLPRDILLVPDGALQPSLARPCVTAVFFMPPTRESSRKENLWDEASEKIFTNYARKSIDTARPQAQAGYPLYRTQS